MTKQQPTRKGVSSDTIATLFYYYYYYLFIYSSDMYRIQLEKNNSTNILKGIPSPLWAYKSLQIHFNVYVCVKNKVT